MLTPYDNHHIRALRALGLFFLPLIALVSIGCGRVIGHPEHPQAQPAVARLLSDDPVLIRESTVEIKSLGETAMPALYRSMSGASPQQQARIIELALQIKEPRDILEDMVAQAAQGPHEPLRVYAIKKEAQLLKEPSSLAGQIRGTTPQDVLSKHLRDDSANVRLLAFRALSGMDSKDAITNDDLTFLIHDQDPVIMTSAAALAAERGFTFQGPEDREVSADLRKLLFHGDPLVRATSCKALGLTGAHAQTAVAPIRKLLKGEQNTVVQLQAAIALTRIGDPRGLQSAIPILRSLSNNSDSSVRIAATSALAQAEIRSAQSSPPRDPGQPQ